MIEWRMTLLIHPIKKNTNLSFRAKGLRHAKQRILQEIRSNLPEKKPLYLEAKGAGVYTILSDLGERGKVILRHENN